MSLRRGGVFPSGSIPAASGGPRKRRHSRRIRAHGRIGPYMNCPCHVQMILQEKEENVEKPTEESAKKPIKFTRKQIAKRRLRVGGGL